MSFYVRIAHRGMVQDHSLPRCHKHEAKRGMVQDHSLPRCHEHGPSAEWSKTIPYTIRSESNMGMARNQPKVVGNCQDKHLSLPVLFFEQFLYRKCSIHLVGVNLTPMGVNR